MVPVDIAYDPVPEYKYKEEEDLTKFKSKKTGRGPLQEGWKVKYSLSKLNDCEYLHMRLLNGIIFWSKNVEISLMYWSNTNHTFILNAPKKPNISRVIGIV